MHSRNGSYTTYVTARTKIEVVDNAKEVMSWASKSYLKMLAYVFDPG